MVFKKSMLALMLAGVTIFTSACGNGKDQSTSNVDANNASVTEAQDQEQFMNALMDAEPTTLDAQKGSDNYGNIIVNNIYEPLVRLREKDGKLEVEPAAAESYEISDDGLKYTFHLRDLNWDDGQAVTAKDFEYGIKRSADPETGSEIGFLLEPIKNFSKVNSGEAKIDELGVKAVDDKTLEVELEKPAAYFIKLAPFRVMFPQRQDVVEKNGEQFGSEPDTLIGCGPFKLESWTHNSDLKLVKSDTYWDKDNVKLQYINYKIATDVNTALNALDVGEVDSAATTLPEWTEKFDKRDDLVKDPIGLPSVDYLALNSKDELFKNKKIRQAITVALDRQGLIDQVYQGVNDPAYGWVPPVINAGEENYAEARGEGPLKELIDNTKDPKALFVEGLKELGMDEDPSKITIDFSFVNNPLLKSMGEYVQANLKEKLGLNVNINMMEWPVLNTNISKGEYQMGYLAWAADYDDPYAMLSLFTKDANAVNTGWTNEEYDKLVKEASKETDTKKAIEKYKEAEKLLLEEAPVVPILTVTTNRYHYNYVKGTTTSQFATTGWKYQYTEGRDK